MAELKTKKTSQSVEAFIKKLPDERKRKDAFTILEMMKKITGDAPKMWGTSIIGFGDYHYKYASGREGDWFRIGFSPRKQNLTLYLGFDVVGQHNVMLKKLGKYKTGKGCLYINKLDDIDLDVLREMLETSYKASKQM
jgi:hypothetical protein